MEIEVRTLQIGKTSWAHPIIESYEKKVSHFCPIKFKMFKDERDFLKSVDTKDYVVICDERGQSFSSRQWASRMEKIVGSGKKKCVLLIGGPFGLSDAVKDRADLSISLSHFVFNQEVALVVLFEQLFRSFTIINNHPYHND